MQNVMAAEPGPAIANPVPRGHRAHPFDAPIQIHATGFVGMDGDIGLTRATIQIGDQEAESVAPSALPRFSRAVEEFLQRPHRMVTSGMRSMTACFHEAARLMGYVPDPKRD
jgi:hypothetical protein